MSGKPYVCWFLAGCLPLLAVCTMAEAQQVPATPNLITQSVNAQQLVTLAGNVHPAVTASNDRGAASPALALHLMLLLKRSSEQQQMLDRYARQLLDANSPNYHKWLTPQEYGARFGLSDGDLSAISNWLSSNGLSVDGVSTGRNLISFSGTAAQVEAAFHTTIHNLSVNGTTHFANVTDPQIPAALAPTVAGVVKLNDFMPVASHTSPELAVSPGTTIGMGQYVGPQDLETIYDFNDAFQAGYSGQGQTIVVLERTNLFDNSDWAQFRKVFGLTRPYAQGTYAEVHPSGPMSCANPGVNSDNFEAIVDAEWASAAAPNAHIVLASCADNSVQFGALVALVNLLNGPPPPAVMSLSYQESEDQLGATENAFLNDLYEQAAVEGVSLFVASGDSGADADTLDRRANLATQGINVNGLASTPFNVSVGGTDFSDRYYNIVNKYWNIINSPFLESAKSYIPEIPWNESCANLLLSNYYGFATPYGPHGFCNSSYAATRLYQTVIAAGGGPSKVYTKPSWQSAVGVPDDGVRDLPDISLFAASGRWNHAYLVCYSGYAFPCVQGYYFGSGGTSFSAPILAGVQALVNQRTGDRAGNPNPVYYAMARAQYGATGSTACESTPGNSNSNCVFHDVTLGDIDIYCSGTKDCFLDGLPHGVLSTSDTTYQPAYRAGTGWDFATGLGTIDVYNFILNWPTGSTP